MKKTLLFTTVILSIFACKKEAPPTPAPQVQTNHNITTIGANYQGGIVGYIDGSGQHGLIMTSFDQSLGTKWCLPPGTSFIFSNPGQYGTTSFINDIGKSNTAFIVNYYGAGNYAAYLCDTLTLNGYSDWFLPAIDEFYKAAAGQPGLSLNTYYWTSSEGASNGAYEVYTGGGSGVSGNKLQSYHVRAVRRF